MRLIDLEPTFYRVTSHGHWREVDTIGECQGIRFLCPKCFRVNGGPIGTHGIICWSRSRGVADDETPGPGRWKIEGTGFDDLTLNADPPSGARSVEVRGGCAWHGHITNGVVTDA